MRKGIKESSPIELVSVVKDSSSYINYYMLKDNKLVVLLAIKPKDLLDYIYETHHINWIDKPNLYHDAQITSELTATFNNGRCHLKSINENVKEISLSLGKKLIDNYGEQITIRNSKYISASYGRYIAFFKNSIDIVISEINMYVPKSQGINKKSIGVTRETAKKIILEITETAKRINQDSESLYKVKLLGVFGSYVNSDKDKLGDIDFFFTIAPKDGVTEKMIRDANEKLMTETDKSSFFLKTMARSYKMKELTLRRLKNKHISVSLHDYETHKEILKTEKFDIIFTD